jgi:hypothetical protein
MIKLNYESAHNFVEKNKPQGFYWDGWTLVKFTPHSAAYTDAKGVYKNNKWGYANRYYLKPDGTWEISDKYVKFI